MERRDCDLIEGTIICLEGLRKTITTLVRKASLWAEIYTGDFLNLLQEWSVNYSAMIFDC
jgi:hypothetical protein